MSTEIYELTCIGCPMGCLLSVEMEEEEVVKVYGNTCPTGDSYARDEMTNPTRIVTSTVRTDRGEMLSVKTASPISKGKIFDCMQALKGVVVQAPVHIGDVIVKNVVDTGVDVIATKTMY